MHCFVRQSVIHRAGNARTGEVKVIRAAGSEGELLIHLFHRQRNVCKLACVIGFIVAVALLVEDLQGIVARHKVGRDFDVNRSGCFGGLCNSAIILCAAVIRNDDGDIFICPRGCPAVIQLNGIAGVAIGSFFRFIKITAII